MIIIAAVKYPRSARTVSHDDVVPSLLRSGARYCLVLRPFGQDTRIVLPKLNKKGRPAENFLYTRNVTVEQVITTAARSVLGVRTYGIVDQRTAFAAPGPTWMRTADDHWQSVVLRLIQDAHVIVLIVPPEQELGDGFLWEVEQIRCCARAARVIIVIPCDERDQPHVAALRRARVLLAMLDSDVDRVAERRVLVADRTYPRALADAMRGIDHEHS